MSHPLRTSVEDFVEGLKSLEKQSITTEVVARYMDQMRLSAEALRPYTYFRESFYTRNLVFRDHLFEVMAICWLPGQITPIHTHNGQLGWMTIAQGEIAVHNYRYVRCNCPDHMNVVGMDCLAGATQIDLDRLETMVCSDSGPVYTVDKSQTIHQIDNSDKARSGCVSLHVYSLPIDSCVGFDMEHQRCFRKTLHYYSRYGKVEVEAEQTPQGELKILL